MKNMPCVRAIPILILTLSLALQAIPSMSQPYEAGQLYVCVYDSSGIPTFVGDTVFMGNDSLRVLFTKYGVYAFDRAFPNVNPVKGRDTYLLDRVYLLQCYGDEDSLLTEMGRFAAGIYYYQEKIPVYDTISGSSRNTPGIPPPTDPKYTPSDPLFFQDYALGLIKAEEAWYYEKGEPGVLIGIPDFGFNTQHEDLKTQIHRMFGYPYGNVYHGTVVAGCAAAATDNRIGKSAIGFKCMIMPGYARWDTILNMVDAGAKVINASWISCSPSITHRNCIYLMSDQGTLMVAGAGNGTEGSTSCELSNGFGYPASYDPVVSVTSVGPQDNHVYEDPPGVYHSHSHNSQVDVCSPGYGVLSTCYQVDNNGVVNNSCYSPNWGTSFASPIVAGLAGLIYSARPCLRPEEVKYIIESTARDIYNEPGNQNLGGTLGKGRIDAFKAVLKARYQSQPVNVTITSTEAIWKGEYFIQDYLIIEPGKKLTVKGHVFFNPNAKVIIKPGATLVIEGGVLRNNFCQGMWKGIEVQGQRAKSQLEPEQQGTLMLSDGATIKNALVAVSLVEFDSKGDPVYAGSGGIIQAEDASFINNKVAVKFYPYENHTLASATEVLDNISYFRNVTFRTESKFIDPAITPDAFVKLSGVRGIAFLGCSFINDIPLEADSGFFPATRGKGIYSHNSSFLVDKLNPTSTDQSEFVHLYRGIEAFGTESLKTFTVNESRFDSLCKAIYLKGINNATITRNYISLFNSQVFLPDLAYGIFLDYCTGYKVEENHLIKGYVNNMYDPPDHYGIIVSNSLEDNNIIYNNVIDLMRTGILAQGKNKGNTGTGLQIKCNAFQQCDFDIVVAPDPDGLVPCGIADLQGAYQPDNAPAANQFDRDITYPYESDYKIYSSCGSITYYHNQHVPYSWPTTPADYTTSRITLYPTPYLYEPRTSCPSTTGLPEGQLETIRKDAQIEMGNLLSGGGSQEKIDYQYQLITQATYDLSKIILQDPQNAFYQNIPDLTRLYDETATNSLQLESLTWLYKLIFCHLALGDNQSVSNILSYIGTAYTLTGHDLTEYTIYTDYIALLTGMITNGTTFFELTPDQKAILNNLASYRDSRVAIYARNVLNLIGHRENQEHVFISP